MFLQWLLLATLWVVTFVVCSPFGPICFDSESSEFWRMEVFWWLPVTAIPLLCFYLTGWVKAIVKVIAVFIAIASALIGFLFGFWFQGMLSNSGGVIHRLREFTIGKHHLEVYSLNMQGALGLDQIELRQVRQILPGVKLVKVIDSVYGQYDLSVSKVDDNTIRYVRKPAGSESSVGEVVTRALD